MSHSYYSPSTALWERGGGGGRDTDGGWRVFLKYSWSCITNDYVTRGSTDCIEAVVNTDLVSQKNSAQQIEELSVLLLFGRVLSSHSMLCITLESHEYKLRGTQKLLNSS